MSMPEYDRSDPMGMMGREPYYEAYRPYYAPSMPQVFLDECSYAIEKRKMNEIAEKVEKYFDEVPQDLKDAFTQGKPSSLLDPTESFVEKDTEKLKDSTYHSGRERRPVDPGYNLELLNELSTKIKS